MPLCGTGSGRAVLGKPVVQTKRKHSFGCLLLSGKAQIGWNGGADLGQRKSLEHNPAPGPCLWQERSVSIANCMVSQKGRGRVWGNRRFLPHMERSGSPRRNGHQKKKAPFGARFFWCGRWDSNPHTEVLASKTRASTIPPLPLISLWPCTFTKQQADKYLYYTIFSLGLSIPRPVPTVRGLPVYRRCVRIES